MKRWLCKLSKFSRDGTHVLPALIACLLYKRDQLYAGKIKYKMLPGQSVLSHSFKFLYHILYKFSILQLHRLVVNKNVHSTVSTNSVYYSGNKS
jgi:hypothetical protein